MNKKVNIIVPITALILSCLFIFTTLDKKIFDLFMLTKKEIPENEIIYSNMIL